MDWTNVILVLDYIVTYGIPLAALVVSIVALKSSKSQKLQDYINDLELKIKQHELAELDKQNTAATLACVEARVIKISQGKYNLKVWNSGQATAHNVTVIFDENANLTIWNSKMPFEFLDSGKSFEEQLRVHMGTAHKFFLTTVWQDASGKEFTKKQMVSR
jgi:hypothetical protein